MLLSITNIAWAAENDVEMYTFLHDSGFSGLEIAPSRIFPDKPYEHITGIRRYADELRKKYGLLISSMQSIWYGRSESIFGSCDERNVLIEYTKKAVDFAAAAECKNIVFGCPINRNVPKSVMNSDEIALNFFARISEYAAKNGVVIALEPNPPIYGTNFINTTEQAIGLYRNLNVAGFRINIDVGTMIVNNESVSLVAENLDTINHIHISEPKLVPIERRNIHQEILSLPFDKYVSIEMGNCGDLKKVLQTIEYIKCLVK